MIVNAFNKNQCDFGVAYIDVDWFKEANDEFGHEFGDFVLKEFAKLASSQLRDSDSFYRIGGEDFVILFMRGKLDGICQKSSPSEIQLKNIALSQEKILTSLHSA